MIKLASDLNTELFAHRQCKECKKKTYPSCTFAI